MCRGEDLGGVQRTLRRNKRELRRELYNVETIPKPDTHWGPEVPVRIYIPIYLSSYLSIDIPPVAVIKCQLHFRATVCIWNWVTLGALWVILGSLWGHFGVTLRHFGVSLGLLWGTLGSLWVILGSLWDHFGVRSGFGRLHVQK